MTKRFISAWFAAPALFVTAALFATFANFPIPAAAAEFNQMLPGKSAISFVFTQMSVPVEGRFKQFKGQLHFDPAKPTSARAEIDIDLASIDAGSAEADEEVAGKLWFNTKTYPTARFVSTSIKPVGDKRFAVAGKMSIKGKTRDASTTATFREAAGVAHFEGSFILKRADFAIGEGMWADFGTVANEIQIKFRLAAVAAGK